MSSNIVTQSSGPLVRNDSSILPYASGDDPTYLALVGQFSGLDGGQGPDVFMRIIAGVINSQGETRLQLTQETQRVSELRDQVTQLTDVVTRERAFGNIVRLKELLTECEKHAGSYPYLVLGELAQSRLEHQPGMDWAQVETDRQAIFTVWEKYTKTRAQVPAQYRHQFPLNVWDGTCSTNGWMQYLSGASEPECRGVPFLQPATLGSDEPFPWAHLFEPRGSEPSDSVIDQDKGVANLEQYNRIARAAVAAPSQDVFPHALHVAQAFGELSLAQGHISYHQGLDRHLADLMTVWKGYQVMRSQLPEKVQHRVVTADPRDSHQKLWVGLFKHTAYQSGHFVDGATRKIDHFGSVMAELCRTTTELDQYLHLNDIAREMTQDMADGKLKSAKQYAAKIEEWTYPGEMMDMGDFDVG